MRFDQQLDRDGRSGSKVPQPLHEGRRVRKKEGVGRALAAAGLMMKKGKVENRPYPKAIGQGEGIGGRRSRSEPPLQMEEAHPPPPLPPTLHQQVQPSDILTYTGGMGYSGTPKDVREGSVGQAQVAPKAKRRSVSAGGGGRRPPRRPSPGTFCQEQPQKTYTKFNYGLKRDTVPQTNIYSTPKKEPATPSRARDPSPGGSNRVQDADGAWERLVQLAKDDFSAEELAMLYWDTLSKLLLFYHIEEPMEVARIELTWKEIQAARSSAAGGGGDDAQAVHTPVVPSQKGCRDHQSKHAYTPYTYTVVRDPPSVTRNTRSGTPVVTPQQESDAKRSSSLSKNHRSASPAQRPWM